MAESRDWQVVVCAARSPHSWCRVLVCFADEPGVSCSMGSTHSPLLEGGHVGPMHFFLLSLVDAISFFGLLFLHLPSYFCPVFVLALVLADYTVSYCSCH